LLTVAYMRYLYSIFALLIISCRPDPKPAVVSMIDTFSSLQADVTSGLFVKDSVSPQEVVTFAKTLIGTKYAFGCSAPATGFDCSGFMTYVFNHFNIDVPRSSVDFTNEGISVALDNAHPGDLILFTGTDSRVRTVGHIGLVVSNDTSGLSFIHSSSGKENAVIITKLNDTYMVRFVKVIKIIR